MDRAKPRHHGGTAPAPRAPRRPAGTAASSPADIERRSMEIIRRELEARGVTLPEETASVVERVIHTTADFDYAENLRFTPDAVALGARALRGGVIVTDTNMAYAGVSKPALNKLGAKIKCYMADNFVGVEAQCRGITRAAVSMEHALREHPGAVLAVGNAPTALLKIVELMEDGARPSLVIGVPVGFVNVEESKERALSACERLGVPGIIALGRKGGSNVAAAICNAILYTEADLLDPGSRM